MFLKLSLWKKLLKKSWKSEGLTVGSSQEDYYMAGTWWMMKIKKESMSNKEKAVMIEMIGEFPEEGETVRCIEGEGNQYEIETMEEIKEILERTYAKDFYETKIIYQEYDKYFRVYQEDMNNFCIMVRNDISELIDMKAMDPIEETAVEGPFGIEGGNCLMWRNNIMEFCVFGICFKEGTEANEIIKLLESMTLPRVKE